VDVPVSQDAAHVARNADDRVVETSMTEIIDIDGDEFYCPKCDRWFPADSIRDYMHSVVLSTAPEPAHVVLPKPEALALLREKGRTR